MMSIGSVKRPGGRYHRESQEYASEECFYRHVLINHLLGLLVQRSSFEVLVGRQKTISQFTENLCPSIRSICSLKLTPPRD
jgi:hypothetical protein